MRFEMSNEMIVPAAKAPRVALALRCVTKGRNQ
jgi:hypothetical protein